MPSRSSWTRLGRIIASMLLMAVMLAQLPSLGPARWAAAEDALEAPRPSRPSDGDSTRNDTPRFLWRSVSGAEAYLFELATDPHFSAIVIAEETTERSFTPETPLPGGITYFWRTAAVSAEGDVSDWSEVWSVTIEGEPVPTPEATPTGEPPSEEPASDSENDEGDAAGDEPAGSVVTEGDEAQAEVAAAAVGLAVTGLVLVNADTNRDIGSLADGATLDLAALPTRNLSVRAEVAGSVGSVIFSLDGKRIQTENIAPYAIAGDNDGNFTAWELPTGAIALSATPYTESGGNGDAGTAISVTLTVVDGIVPPAPVDNPPATGSAPCSVAGVIRRVDVSSSRELADAIDDARAGDLIVLADGTYTGKFKATAAGTAANRITLCGSRKAVVRQADHSGTTLFFDGAAYWTVDGLTLRNGVFAVRIERSRHITLQNLDIGYTGQAGVLVRYNSVRTILQGSWIHDTGLNRAEYGEGIYIGQNHDQWPNGQPDRSDLTYVLDNTFGPNVRAEAVDVKEGTSNGVVRGNSFDGSGMTSSVSYIDSWVDIKGNGWLVAGNRGSVIPRYGDGYEVTGSISGWGRDNVFRDNYGDVRVRGGGDGRFGVHIPAHLRGAGNLVSCSNEFVNVDNYSVPDCIP